jgi:hypothetical protein
MSPVLARDIDNNGWPGDGQGGQGGPSGNGQGCGHGRGAGGSYGAPAPVLGGGFPILVVGYGVYWVIRRRKKAASQS